ncbi:MAG: long-chain-fatty-acid--CoA ligase [Rhodospirillales bacterium]|nr:fatty-acid--CoA ligase [Rhodospirillaceae bacterium]MDP6429683.1 long-chain-fatty-acid--CoA ligase [Rhodospirillales bacterium]
MTGMTLGLHRAVQQRPQSIATIFGARKKTWSEVGDRIARFAGILRRAGVGRDDRVAILAFNSDIYFEFYLAVPWAGAAVVPLNHRWTVTELAYGINDSGSRLLLVDDAFCRHAGELQAACSGLRGCIYIGDAEPPDGMPDLRDLLDDTPGIDEDRRAGSDLFGIFYTSGTTAEPKGVMLSHLNVWSSALSMLAEMRFDADDIYLHCAPMFHLADGVNGFAALLSSATHAFIKTFEPGHLIDVIERDRVTVTILVPTMIGALLANPRIRSADLSCLRALQYGAAPMSDDLLRRTIETLPAVDIYQGFGQTELAPVISVLGPEDHVLDGPRAHRSRSAGQASFCVQVKIADQNGNRMARREVGEIWVRGPNVMLGYINKPDETARVLVDGWIRTGDAAYMDGDGYIYIVDRIKDMVITGGENVASIEVENVISAHPSVAMCAVIGVPDEKWGEKVHAVVVPQPGAELSEAEIIAHCKERMAGFKCPRSADIRSQPLPLSGSGKILKRELRESYPDRDHHRHSVSPTKTYTKAP